MMKYRQLTSNERYIISHLLKQGFNPSEIARQIGRHRSTITRELDRNRCTGIDSSYRYSRAQRRTVARRHISERPKIVETRRTRDHVEIDTVVGRGSKDCIVTIVERKSRHVLIGKMKDRTTRSLNLRCIKLLDREPAKFKTITADNGTEFNCKEVKGNNSVKKSPLKFCILRLADATTTTPNITRIFPKGYSNSSQVCRINPT